MSQQESIDRSPGPEEAHQMGHDGRKASQIAAAVEAAYILEAVRK